MTTIFAVLVAVSNAVVAIFSYMLAVHNTRNDRSAKKDDKIDSAEKSLRDACDKGTMSDLLDTTKSLGDSKK